MISYICAEEGSDNVKHKSDCIEKKSIASMDFLNYFLINEGHI